MPGFGLVVALITLIAAAMLAWNRRPSGSNRVSDADDEGKQEVEEVSK